jgi:short-subunit dehydrogenase
MNNALLLIGAGPGIGLAVAELFGQHGYRVGLINRQPAQVAGLVEQLTAKGIEVHSEAADAAQPEELTRAIAALQAKLGPISALLYNVAAMKSVDILAETAETLTQDFRLNVANALLSVQLVHADLKATQGVVLLTGGGLALTPYASSGSLSIGKAGLRSLAQQLHDRLKDDGIYAGTLTITGKVRPESPTHSPALLAGLYWKMAQERTVAEIQH